MMPILILVHGAWHNGAGFTRLQGELEKIGISSKTVELPSVGSASAELEDMYTDADVVRSAIAEVEDECVVLGHSYGGLAITQGASGSEKVKRLIFLTAFMLDEGETLYAACGSVDPAWWNIAPDKTRLTANTPENIFYNKCSPEIAAEATGMLRTQSLPAFNQVITKVAWKEIPSTYIICEQDNAIPVFAQEAMSGRASQQIRIDSDHSPFLSSPKELADIISKLM
jgi:pimeloyl-ACP methyl ester carboxylesterase